MAHLVERIAESIWWGGFLWGAVAVLALVVVAILARSK